MRWGVVAHDEHLGGATVYVGTIRPGERALIGTVRGAPRRGEARTGWVELRSAAPFGVAERRRRLPADATTLVLPRVVPLGALPFVDLASSREAATETEPRRGQGPEYLGVREYRPGDPIRQVHWRLTARHGELVVRDLEEHRVPRLALWIDTSIDEDRARRGMFGGGVDRGGGDRDGSRCPAGRRDRDGHVARIASRRAGAASMARARCRRATCRPRPRSDGSPAMRRAAWARWSPSRAPAPSSPRPPHHWPPWGAWFHGSSS